MSDLAWPLSVPILTDGVVTLRAHTPADLDDLLAMAQDPAMVRWTSVATPHTRAMSEQFAFEHIPAQWNAGTGRMWAIEADGRFAGNIDLRGTDTPIGDLGFALHPWARGRGLMVRAVRLVVDHAFTVLGQEVVHWRAHVGNAASLRVAHAAGFTLEGTAGGLLHERGQVLDAWIGSIRFGDPPLPRTTWAEPVTLEGEHVRLRAWRADDVPRLVEARSDPLHRHWLPSGTPATPPGSQTLIDRSVWRAAIGDAATWAVADRTTDQLIAQVSVMDLLQTSPMSGEVGYWAHPDARGRGVVTEAVALAIQHAFDPAGLDRQRLTLLCAAGNAPSNAVARRHGFRHVGTQRRAERLGDGSLDDLECYELLRP